jgi:hypothetical protein
MSAVMQSSFDKTHSSALSNYVSNKYNKKSVDLVNSSYSFNKHKVKHSRDQTKFKRAVITESSKKEECQQFVVGVGYVFLMMLIKANFSKSFYIFFQKVQKKLLKFNFKNLQRRDKSFQKALSRKFI